MGKKQEGNVGICCTAVVLYWFLSTYIMKIFPTASDPQLVPVTRLGLSCLRSSCGPTKWSAKYCHPSEVRCYLYTTEECLVTTDKQVVARVQSRITCYILLKEKKKLGPVASDNKRPQNQGWKGKYISKTKFSPSFQHNSLFLNLPLSVPKTSTLTLIEEISYFLLWKTTLNITIQIFADMNIAVKFVRMYVGGWQ